MRGTNFPDAEPRAPRRGGSRGGPRWGARLGACARPPAGRSGRLPLCPQPQASATGICALPVGSPRTQGASTAPTRGPKASREQILWGEPGTDPRRPAAAKTLARNLERGARFSGSPPAPMPASLQPCTLGHNADPPLAALAPAAGGERAPLSRSSCTSRAARPPPRRRTAQLRKERRQEIPGSKAPADAPLVPVPFAPSPPPAYPARGGGGAGAAGRGVLPCSARTKPAAGARGRAPSQ